MSLTGPATPRILRRLVAWMAAGALVPLLAVLRSPLTRMPGTPRSDLPKHVWSFWHTATHILEWPHTTALGAPFGGEFLDVMLLPSILMAPVTLLLGPVFAANAWVWGSLLLVGLTTALLALRVVGSERGAVVAGLVAQLSPYLAGYPLASGVHERLAIWVFPLVWLGVLAWRDTGRVQALVWMAVGLFFATAGCQVYGVFALGMLLMGLPLWWPGLRRVLPVLAALGTPLVIAWALVRGPTVSAQSLVPQQGRMDLWPGQPAPDSWIGMELGDLLDPTRVAQQAVTEGGDELYMLVYLGWAVLAAAVAGAWRLRGQTTGLVGVGLAMATLAFGPVVMVGSQLSWNPVHVALSLVLPAFRTIPVPWQALGATVPLLAVGVAASVDRFRSPWAAIAVVVVIALERAVVLPVSLVLPATDTVPPAVYAEVTGPVVEVPRMYRDTTLTPGQVFLAQTIHEQDFQLSINAGTLPLDHHLPTLRAVSTDWHRDARCWGSLGFTRLVLHRDWLSPSIDATATMSALRRALGEPLADDGVQAVFAIPEARRQTRRLPHYQGGIELLLDQGLIGGPPPQVPHRAERCPGPPAE